MEDITIIVPIHQYNSNVKQLLENSLKSVPSETKIILSCFETIVNDIKNDFSENKFLQYNIHNDNKFTSLVNTAVEKVETKWFSILEFDDVYTEIWFNNFKKYEKFNPDVSVFVPLTDLIDYETKRFIGYGNEAVWASSFSNDLGLIDNDCLQNFFDFYMTGSIFNTEDWKEYGGLKNSIKLTFWYEFLLRFTYHGKKIMVVPRVGYVHNLNREESLIKIYSETIDEKESQGWVDIAKQEYFFKMDRNKIYKATTEED